MEFRKHFGYDVEAASNAAVVAVDQIGESMTVQSMAEDADINVLMARFGITGKMPSNPRIPTYGDFTGVTDYQSALNAVGEAMEGFMELPASVRARFENNPQLLLQFCSDERNLEEARKLGLLKEPQDGGVQSGGSVAAGAGVARQAVKAGDAASRGDAASGAGASGGGANVGAGAAAGSAAA